MSAYVPIAIVAAVAAAYQLRRVPRVWAFLLLFIVLMPKVALAVVPGNTTPIRVDDVVIATVLATWIFRRGGPVCPSGPTRRSAPTIDTPASPLTFFLLLYWSLALACTLVGIASLTTAPLTGALHFARLVEYGLLYYFFYTAVRLEELPDVVEVLRTTLLIVCGIWVAQHWTHAPTSGPATPWATLYPTFSATYDFGGYVMLATVTLYALWSRDRDSRNLWTTIAIVVGAWVTVNSDSRASLLGLALVVAFDIVARRRWRTAVVAAALVLAAPYVIKSKKMMTLVHGVFALITSFNADVIRQAFATDPSLALRVSNWRLAIDHWLARPFVGDGLGGYLRYTRQYDLPASTDGWYVRVLADTGVLGLVGFLLLLGALLWMLLRAVRVETRPLRRAMVYGAALGVVSTAASAVLVDAFVSYKIMGVFWMLVALGTRVAAEHGAGAVTYVAAPLRPARPVHPALP